MPTSRIKYINNDPMPKNPIPFESKVFESALALIEKDGWGRFSLKNLAQKTKTPLPKIMKRVSTKEAIVPFIVGFIDKDVEKSVSPIDESSPPRDRLFEIIMARFDILQNYRGSIQVLMDTARHDMRLARLLVQAQCISQEAMLSMAKIKGSSISLPIQKVGLAAIYAYVAYTWKHDQTKDMSKTMASLDKVLNWFDKLAKFMK